MLAPPKRQAVEEWEEWEDEDVVTPIETDDHVLIANASPSNEPASPSRRSLKSLSKSSRQSVAKIKRLRSRQRQKAQNAKAGISLITDMAALRRQNHITSQVKSTETKNIKFSDAAALKALEGEPTSASVGNWNWFSKGRSLSSTSPKQICESPEEISPNPMEVSIGIGVTPVKARAAHPSRVYTTIADLETPVEVYETPVAAYDQRPELLPQATQNNKSVWSPDTPDTISSFSPRAASSVYSQVTVPGVPNTRNAPPVPALPAGYKKQSRSKSKSIFAVQLQDKNDSGSPCTLFEEDGTSPLRSAGAKSSGLTPDSAGSRSHGWWDHVVSPFVDKRLSFASRKTKMDSPETIQEDDTWMASTSKNLPATSAAIPVAKTVEEAPIVRVPTPRRTPPPIQAAYNAVNESPESKVTLGVAESVTIEKPRIIVTDSSSIMSLPPPYSPQRKGHNVPIRYRAVFPPGHALHSQYPPTPRPTSPSLAGTMTSQGSPRVGASPLTPPARVYAQSTRPQNNLPPRALGTYLPDVHNQPARGSGLRIERQRRRHEKEEVMARRAGGFCRGRGCIPTSGCYGRTGREGRKRRRVWVGTCCGVIAALILIIVLAVTLTRPHHSHQMPSIWVNLTDYPPMPTGVLTVVGPDNTVARSGCTEPSTLWSCSLPKDDQESNDPYKPNQPTVIMQIQWDNSTRNDWKVPNGDVPVPLTRRGTGAATIASSVVRSRDERGGFTPNPKAPEFKEMWFMGETTDEIMSDQKAGEPTPFYISLLPSTDKPIAMPKLEKRVKADIGDINLTSILPQPDLEDDGTPSPAVMLPKPVQQPVRLFDRGLPTEHYGFYTHFRRTIYLKSVTVLNETSDDNVPLDEDGGCRKSEASFLTAWGETRMLVRIWTRKLESNTSSLLHPDDTTAKIHRPGTMPYPVTVTLDTHGGDPTKKLVWDWPIDNRQHLQVDKAELLANNMAVGGTWVNRRGSGDAKYGGFDGGSGGCQCEWVNWV